MTRCDWSAASGRIASGGEDGKVKVWDSLGRAVFASHALESVVTAVCWAPGLASSACGIGSGASGGNGAAACSEVLVAGCHGVLRLMDGSSGAVLQTMTAAAAPPPVSSGGADAGSSPGARRGKGDAGGSGSDSKGDDASKSATGASVGAAALGPQLPPFSGSVTAVAWTSDGSLVAVGTGSGAVLTGSPLDVEARTPNGTFTATLVGPRQVRLRDLGASASALSAASADRDRAGASGDGEAAGSGSGSSSGALSDSDGAVVLETRDRITGLSLGYGYLLLATPSQVAVYAGAHSAAAQPIAAGAMPSHTVDTPRAPVRVMAQAPRHFATVDAAGGLAVYAYDGRCLSQPKGNPIAADALSAGLLSLSHDVLAVCDRADAGGGGRTVRMWDAKTGRPLPTTLVHHQPITFLAVSQGAVPPPAASSAAGASAAAGGSGSGAVATAGLLAAAPPGAGAPPVGLPAGTMAERRLLFIDAAADAYVTPLLKPAPVKVAAMVDTAAWNDACDVLTVAADGQLLTWLAPSTLATDADLSGRAKVKADASVAALAGAGATIVAFSGPRLTLRRADGSRVHATVAHSAQLLHECVAGGRWGEALRLARFVRQEPVWAALASLSLAGSRPHLDTAEAALAAIRAVDRLAWVAHVRSLALPERRNAEMAAYRRQVDEAEGILLQAAPPLLYRALKLNVRAHRWERAMQLALQHAGAVAAKGGRDATFVDVVLWYRARHNASLHRCVASFRWRTHALYSVHIVHQLPALSLSYLRLTCSLLSHSPVLSFCSEETSEIFHKAAAQLASTGGSLDDAAIAAKKTAEREKEAARAQASGAVAPAAAARPGIGGAAASRSGGAGAGGAAGGGAAADGKFSDDDFTAPEL